MNITASHREFARAHKVRMDKFWPDQKPLRVRPAKPPQKDFYDLAWDLLAVKPGIREIQEMTAEHFGVPVLFMETARKTQEAYLPRAVAIYLCKQFTTKSYPVIGRHFGGRDHTTIMHSVRAVEQMIALKHPIAKDVQILSDELGA